MKIKSLLLALLLVFLFSGCQSTFDQYADEAEDCVRFQLAVANSVSEFTDLYSFMQWFSSVTEMSEVALDGESYRDMLEYNSPKDPFYATLLEYYDSVDVVLSKPKKAISGDAWTFMEINSDLHFTFSLIPAQNGDVYYKCVVDEEEFAELVQANFMKRAIDLIK